jgi:UDP-hydrolysing UDP-N-acetyl-D-glucosamine 2-epimerase
MLGIPVGHIHGGEITFGSKDDMYRHAITKLSSLHFVANVEFRDRVISMGEDPAAIFMVGGLGVDSISRVNRLSREELEASLGIILQPTFALVTYHPDSNNPKNSLEQLRTVLRSLDRFTDIQFIVTGANADHYGNEFNQLLKIEALKRDNLSFFVSLGQQKYLSLLAEATFILGNSSSGLLEAPYLKVPTINVGERQNGRPRANSVIDVICDEMAIIEGIERVTAGVNLSNLSDIENPYGYPGASAKIVGILEECEFDNLLPKRFIDAN